MVSLRVRPGKEFIADRDASSVAVFDLETLKITGKIKNFPNTDSIIYDSASTLIFTLYNGDSRNATSIDAVKETVEKAIDMGGGVEYPVADGKGPIYDNNDEKHDVAAVDTRTFKIKARWPLAPAGGPMAMDREHRRLFYSARDPLFLVMMDADNGKVIQSLPVSTVDGSIFAPETGLSYISTREGNIHIFHQASPNKRTEVGTVNTEFGGKTMGFDPKTPQSFSDHHGFRSGSPAPTKETPGAERKPIVGTFCVLIYER